LEFLYLSDIYIYEVQSIYEDVLKLEGLGWIEYKVPIYNSYRPQLSIEVNSVDMVYFLLTYYSISFKTKYNNIL
jgi:hypothetical protein